MTKIAIIDIIGLTYDGTTLESRGLGGSESAVILMSKELASLGFDVTVFNNCIDQKSSPGIYSGVRYRDLIELDNNANESYDVVISSRTVVPFLPEALWGHFAELNPQRFGSIKKNAKLKIVWMHDTFCRGDHLLEDMVTHGDIDELFTLSDFHTTYVSTCDHGKKRMFEVLKRHIFQTRNGIVKYDTGLGISDKNPHQYVYNASVTKGMLPLVTSIWPKIKARLPQATLKVIGGYYRFREGAAPDAQEQTWRQLVADPKYAALGVEFTGVIPQYEIANILAKSSFMLYPGAFPETFGISTLESLAYNTPLITTRFGALEETAVSNACYLMDYPIEPNSLFPFINTEDQQNKFVDMVLRASADTYLHQQKQYACNLINGISTWDTVALQWKQHILSKLGEYMPVNEYRKVSAINSSVREVFGRRFSNSEDIYIPRNKQRRIVVVTATYNAENYIERCIESVVTQDYDNWLMVITDDCSTDNTANVLNTYDDSRIKIVCNPENRGAVYNQVTSIRKWANDDDIVILLDGDDWLINNNQIFHKINNAYESGATFTYGSCWSLVDNIPLVAQPYPEHVKREKKYREHLFNWNMPYTHLRTFSAGLLSRDDDSDFKDPEGNWYKAGGDGSLFYHLIEKADPNTVVAIPEILYVYNDKNPLNDYKVNGEEQTRNAKLILKSTKKEMSTDKFSVIIPTMWRAQDVFHIALRNLIRHPMVDDIIIIDNDHSNNPGWAFLKDDKVRVLVQQENIGVNPAWNLGVSLAKNEMLCISNDDIYFDVRLFEKITPRIKEENSGAYGIITGEAIFNQPPSTDYSIDFKQWVPGDIIHCFGQLFFMKKSDWVHIPEELKIFFGDDFVFHSHLMAGRKNYLIYNIRFYSPMAATTKDKALVGDAHQREFPVWERWFKSHPILN